MEERLTGAKTPNPFDFLSENVQSPSNKNQSTLQTFIDDQGNWGRSQALHILAIKKQFMHVA